MGIVKQPLHEISDAFRSIDEMVNNGDISEDDIVDQIEAMEGEFKQKAIQVSTIRHNLNPVVDGIDAEIKRLTARKKAVKNRQDSLSGYLQVNMSKAKIPKINHDLFNITLCQGREIVIVDKPEDIDGKFVEVEVVEKINKASLLKALKEEREAMKENDDYDADNEVIKGAHIERAKSFIKIG